MLLSHSKPYHRFRGALVSQLGHGVVLSSSSQSSSALSAMHNMRQKAELCDVNISVKNQCIRAHRTVLAATIPFFTDMFLSDCKKGEKDVTINEVDADALECLINYAYGKELKITEKNARSLFVASEFLKLDMVKRVCATFMAESLNVENVLEVRNFAEGLSSTDLIVSSERYLLENMEEFLKSKRFLKLPFSVCRDIMKGMAFYRAFSAKPPKEETIFEAIISWVEVSQETHEMRQRMLYELFCNIQLERVSIDYLCERIATEEMIKTSPSCSKLIEEAKAAHALSHTVSIFSQLFYRSLRPTAQEARSIRNKSRPDDGALCAVCYSEKFGLYVRNYDSDQMKWTTLTRGIRMKSGFEHVICRSKAIDVFGKKECVTFEIDAREWSTKEEPSPVFYKTVKHGNKMYVFDDEPCSSNGSLVWKNNIPSCSTGTTSAEADRECNRIIMPSVACLAEHLYISGGRLDGKCLNLFEKYSTVNDTWTTLPPMRSCRCGQISAVLKNKIYICGGMNDAEENLNLVEAFATDLNYWTSVSHMKVARSRFSLVSWKEKLYAVGGAENSGLMYSFEIFDPKKCEWERATPIYVWDDVRTTKVKIVSLPSNDYYDY